MKKGSLKVLISLTIGVMATFFVVLSCNGQKRVAVDQSLDNVTTSSPLTILVQGSYAGTDTVVTQIVENKKSLANFFSQINMTRKPGLAVPEVDFSKNTVLIYCSGKLGNGTVPELTVVEESEAQLRIGMKNKQDTNIVATTVSPFVIYKIPSTSKKIIFEKAD